MSFILKRLTRSTAPSGPLLLVIMDGVGVGSGDEYDAVARAHTPTLDHLRTVHPYRTLRAHGVAVGLPGDGDMGNSEVCHNAMGAGRVLDQGAKLVNQAVSDGSLFKGEGWQGIVKRCSASGGALHLIGLLSDGNVHSHQDHLHALIDGALRDGLTDVCVHVLLDGRDVPMTSALIYVERLETLLASINATEGRRFRIASGGGRMLTTMDRYEADWRIVERGWNAHVHGVGRQFQSAREAIESFRAETPEIQDQFLPPFVIAEQSRPVGTMTDGDAVVFFNFRGDRAIEISRAFEEGAAFDGFDRGTVPDIMYAGMTLYEGDLNIPARYLVAPPAIDRTLSEFLAHSGVTQLALSETQKYGHVTYFWNGNRGGKFDEQTETYVEIPSDLVGFETRPWMKVAQITDRTIEALVSGEHRFCRINYPNGDMVGHTGDIAATMLGVSAVDLALSRLIPVLERLDGTLIVTADHGNAEDMVERGKDGRPQRDDNGGLKLRTSHSLNPVPFIIRSPGNHRVEMKADLPQACIGNMSATILELLGFETPEGYLPSLIL
jgi:2,3-bisphosphoglycerate-independent phosphoglycerate mutase